MKIIKRKETFKFVIHLLPFCYSQRINSKHIFDGKNYLWLNMMICFK